VRVLKFLPSSMAVILESHLGDRLQRTLSTISSSVNVFPSIFIELMMRLSFSKVTSNPSPSFILKSWYSLVKLLILDFLT
ncbi:hypothetical protein PIB30_112190, partial [Stylosanthes scabra]|nr:hypothetical protein [Stylosanthes scabra]